MPSSYNYVSVKRRTRGKPRRAYRKGRPGVYQMYRMAGLSRWSQTAFVKLRVVATVASNSGGIITFSYSDNPSSFQDWTSVANLYDEYKPMAIKVHFMPYLPNDTSTVTGFLPLYSVYDDNSTSTPLTSVNDAIQYENMRAFNMYRPWKRYQKLKMLAANATTIVRAGGYSPTASPTATQCVAFYGEGFDISTSYGSIIVTMYLKVRTRK